MVREAPNEIFTRIFSDVLSVWNFLFCVFHLVQCGALFKNMLKGFSFPRSGSERVELGFIHVRDLNSLL